MKTRKGYLPMKLWYILLALILILAIPASFYLKSKSEQVFCDQYSGSVGGLASTGGQKNMQDCVNAGCQIKDDSISSIGSTPKESVKPKDGHTADEGVIVGDVANTRLDMPTTFVCIPKQN